MKPMIDIFIPLLLWQQISESAKLETIYHAKFLPNSIEGDSSVYTFETLLKVSVQQCVNACKTTKACEYINYERRYTKCDLLRTKDDTDTKKVKLEIETKPGCIFGNKSEWIEISSNECEQCDTYGKCSQAEEIENTVCRNSGCGKPNGYDFKGNMLSYGNKVMVKNGKCNEGERMIPRSHLVNESVCLENGTWSASYTCLTGSEFEHSFYYIHTQLSTWFDGRDHCKSLLGHLLDINTEEQRFIETLLVDEYRSNAWTGGNDFRTRGDYRWSDGSVMDYTYWFPGEPDGEIQCVIIAGANEHNFKGWKDMWCDLRYMFICEFEIS